MLYLTRRKNNPTTTTVKCVKLHISSASSLFPSPRRWTALVGAKDKAYCLLGRLNMQDCKLYLQVVGLHFIIHFSSEKRNVQCSRERQHNDQVPESKNSLWIPSAWDSRVSMLPPLLWSVGFVYLESIHLLRNSGTVANFLRMLIRWVEQLDQERQRKHTCHLNVQMSTISNVVYK